MIRWICLHGYQCRYRRGLSDKPDLVFLPGSMQTIENCEDVYASLSRRFNVFLLEVPGISESDYLAPEKDFRFLGRCVEQFCQLLKLESVYLLGFSYGALSAYGFMLESTRIKRAALGGACRQLNRRATADVLEAYKHRENKQSFAKFVTESWMPESTQRARAIKRAVARAIGRMSDETLDKYLANTQRIVNNRQDEINSQPTLIFCGDRDVMISPEEVNEWAGYFHHGEVKFLTDCGHLFHIEARSEVVAIATEFLLRKECSQPSYQTGISLAPETVEAYL